MLTIWKYKLSTEGGVKTILLPKGAKIITVQAQEGEPYISALVNPGEPDRPRFIEIFGTGYSIEDIPDTRLDYIGTFQFTSRTFTFHVFERVNLNTDIS